MATFDTPAFGPYTATYGAADIGLIEGPHNLSSINHAVDRRAGRFGDSVVSGIYTGGDNFVQFVLKEWTAAVKTILYPWGTIGQSGVIGRAMEDLAAALVLTAIDGTPAKTNGPVTRTYPLAILVPEHNLEVLCGNVERNVPIVMRCYPAEVTPGSNELQWFADT